MEKVINIGGRLHNPVVGGAVTGADEIKDDTKGKMQSVINQETDAEMVRLDGAKQDKLTFDQTPTENSTNPVTSGGVYAADAALQQAIEAILLLIPSAASALNQLADKSFVNSSIATSTATFRGTYNVVADLGLTIDATHQQIAEALGAAISTADNNDYCYVQVPIDSESSDIRRTERYKFNGTAWSYEYDLNTSGYTASQWAAINSGITAALVGDLNDIKSYIPAEATALNKLADMAYVLAQIIANIPAFKGQFTTLSDLQAVQSPKAGDCGIVRTKDNDGQDVFTFYQYLNGSWNVYYVLSRHPQRKPVSTGVNGDYPFNGMGLIELPMNMREGWMNDTWLYYPVNGIVYLLYSWNFQLYAVYSNGEGLGLENNVVVKPANYNISDIADIVANRYLPFTEDGGVYTITKPNSSTITSTDLNNTTIVNYNDPSYKGVNVLTQDMMSAANTKYVIKYDFTLGEDITVPADCVLEFDGGSISGAHTITGNNTGINAGLVKIFNTDVTLAGTWNIVEAYPEWWGAKGDFNWENLTGTDDSAPISKCIKTAYKVRIPNIKFSKKRYKVSGDNPVGLEKVANTEPHVLLSEERSINIDFGLAHFYYFPSKEDDCFAFVGYLRHSVWENLIVTVVQSNTSNIFGDIFSTHFGIEGALHRFSENTFRNMSITAYSSAHTFRRFFNSDCSGNEATHHDDLSLFEKVACNDCLTVYYTNNGNSVSITFADCDFSLTRDNSKVFWVNTESWAGFNRFVNCHYTIIDCSNGTLFKIESYNQSYGTVYVDKSRAEIRNTALNWKYFDIANGVIHFGDFFNVNCDTYDNTKIYGILNKGKVDFENSLGVYTPIQLIGGPKGYDKEGSELRFTRCSFMDGSYHGSNIPLISYNGGGTVFQNRYEALASQYSFCDVAVESPKLRGAQGDIDINYRLINTRRQINNDNIYKYSYSLKSFKFYKCTFDSFTSPVDAIITKLGFFGHYDYINQGIIGVKLVITAPDGTTQEPFISDPPTDGTEKELLADALYIKAGTSIRIALMKEGDVEWSDITGQNTYLNIEMRLPATMEELKEIYNPD